jgi:tryptophan synthase alpha chain
MNRIDVVFNDLKKNNKKALMPFITAGYPDIKFTEDCIYEMAEKGANLIEIGLPFSDPIADGKIIQEASYYALSNGINIDKVFQMVENIRKNGVKIPLILMAYYNTLFARNLEDVAKNCLKVGFDGVIVPDLLPFSTNDEKDFSKILIDYNIYSIYLASLLTDENRLKNLVESTKGFLYLIIKIGTTGFCKDFDYDLILQKINEIKNINKDLPIALGFGISNREHVKKLKKYADAVILGSQIVKIIKETKNPKKIGEFISELRDELDNN